MKISLQDIDLDDKQSVATAYEMLLPSLKKFGLLSPREDTKEVADSGVELKEQSGAGDVVREDLICKHHEGKAAIRKITDPETRRARYVILKGSVVKLYCTNNDAPYGKRREVYFKKGLISQNGKVLEDIDDNITSPSLAASIVLGTNANGKLRLTPVNSTI